MSDSDEKLAAEHKHLLAKLKPYMEAEKARLKDAFLKGADWGDFAADKKRNEVIDSSHLVSGEVFFSGQHNDFPVAIRVNPQDDIRLARVMSRAIDLRLQYAGKNVDQYIYKEVLKEINKEFGDYDPAVGRCLRDISKVEKALQTADSEEQKTALNNQLETLNETLSAEYAKRVYSKNDPDGLNINNFPSGRLVCREYTAVAAMALHYAGIETHYVIGDVTAQHATSTGRHAFLVSKKTGNVLEVTANSSNQLEFSYARMLTKEKDIKMGETVVALRADGTVVCYGTGDIGGTVSSDKKEINSYHLAAMESAKNEYSAEIDAAKKFYDKAHPKMSVFEYWDFKDGRFISHDGKRTIEKEKFQTSAGEIEGYKLGQTIAVLQNEGRNFAVHEIESGKIRGYLKVSEFEETPKKEPDIRISERMAVRSQLVNNWDFKDGKFVSTEGDVVELTGKNKGKGYHFKEPDCSLVPQANGSFMLYYKDSKTGKAKLDGKITLAEINAKDHTAALDAAADMLKPLTEYNNGISASIHASMLAGIKMQVPQTGQHI